MGPLNTPKQSVSVEYDYRKRRVSKTFTDAYAARRFFVAKLNAGKNPKVTKGATHET